MCFIRLHRWFYWLVPINSTRMCSTNENPFDPRFYSSDSNPSRVRVSGSASDKSKRCSRCSFLLLYECSYVNLQLNMCANLIKNDKKSQKQKHVHAIHFIDFEFSIMFVFIALTHSPFLEMQILNEMQAHHQFFTILLYTLLNLYFYESSYPPRIPRFFFDTLNSWVIKPTLAMENVLTQLLMHTQHTLMVPGILHSENCKIVK